MTYSPEELDTGWVSLFKRDIYSHLFLSLNILALMDVPFCPYEINCTLGAIAYITILFLESRKNKLY
jgi:hypothetical protein